MYRPDEQINGPYPVDVVGPSFTMDALTMGGVGDDPWAGASSSYVCSTVPPVHPNLQMIREDPASSQGTVSDSGSGSRSDTPQSRPVPTISPPHPVISVTDALGRVMPVVMVTPGDAAAAIDTVPMDDSASAATFQDFPAGYFTTSGYNYPGNYPTCNDPVDLSQPLAGSSVPRTELCSTMIRTHRFAHELCRDVSQALESSSVKELVQICDVGSGLFLLANASVSLEVRVLCGGGDDRGEKPMENPGAALCFRHVAGDVALYDSICRNLVSRLSL